MNIDHAIDNLWEDYLTLAEKHSENMPPYEFGYALIRFSTKLLLDTAPNEERAMEVINLAIESGKDFHEAKP